jgi:hypothetical protein
MNFTCPCCGYRTLSEFPGSYEICSICFWEDDPVQLLDPGFTGGANRLSLVECQANYTRFGACEQRFISNVRPVLNEERDPEWQPAQQRDLKHARAPRDLTREESDRLETWYYWKRTVT